MFLPTLERVVNLAAVYFLSVKLQEL